MNWRQCHAKLSGLVKYPWRVTTSGGPSLQQVTGAGWRLGLESHPLESCLKISVFFISQYISNDLQQLWNCLTENSGDKLSFHSSVIPLFCLQPVSAMFAWRPLPCSYLPQLYWAFHFLPLWLNICFSQLLSGDIKQIGVRFNFEVFISSQICFWDVCPHHSYLHWPAQANTALSPYHPFVTSTSTVTTTITWMENVPYITKRVMFR